VQRRYFDPPKRLRLAWRSEVREADDDGYKKGFVVDTNVLLGGGKAAAYRVTNLHQGDRFARLGPGWIASDSAKFWFGANGGVLAAIGRRSLVALT
jgi:hypothetical protein